MKKLMTMVVLCSLAVAAASQGQGQEKKIKSSLTPEDWAYKMAEGVTAKEVTYYSDGVGCYAKIFYPKGFSASGKTPGVVLGQGWAGTHFSIEKYGARFAERGLVAMAIDYRGWGSSDPFISQAQPTVTTADPSQALDGKRIIKTKMDVTLKRTRLLPMKMVEDYRNAISYLQGEPGVDPDRIGVWGSSFAGGHSIMTAAQDARVKAVAIQIPSIAGKNARPGPPQIRSAALADAIKRARTGQGGEFETGFSTRRMVDIETQQAVAEYRPFHHLKAIGDRPVLFVVAEKEELMNNRDHSYAAMEVLTGPKKLISVPGVTHFEMYVNEPFEISSNAAAAWFREHLGLETKGEATGQSASAQPATAPYDHVHLSVPDPAKAVEWYIKYMGGAKGPGANEVSFGSTLLMFRKADGAGPSAGSVIDHIGFSFSDLDAKMKELQTPEAGAKVTMAVRDVPNLFKLGFIEDPWGVKIEVVQDSETPGFHHIHLRGADPEGLMKWVSDSFGGERAKLKGRIDALKYGSVWVLAQKSSQETAASAGRVVDHLSWRAANLDKSMAELKAKGVKFTSEPRTFGALKFVFVEGPAGLRVEVIQR
ncbi:MAG: VOC family protein [Blastocatellales bacterium]